jgi:CheY-like chemotaxis protein
LISSNKNKPITILLVEDNPGDIRLVQETFKEGKVGNQIEIVKNGEEAIKYLQQRGDYSQAPKPGMILLDLNLPKKNGIEVLAEIKSDPQLRKIPVVVLTASQADEDVVKAYNGHANCYLTKPIDLDDFMNVVQAIKSFWLNIVQLPEENYTYDRKYLSGTAH